MTLASPTEQMIVSAARSLAGVRTVFVGVGMPNIACNLARQTVSPELELIYESGVYGARPRRLPLSIGDPTLVTGSIATVPMADLFGLYLQGGHIESPSLAAPRSIVTATSTRRLLVTTRNQRSGFLAVEARPRSQLVPRKCSS